MPDMKHWIVTISPDQSIQKVAKLLVEQGFALKESLAEVGCITGSADEATAMKIRNLKGVMDIAQDTQIDVGPPDADETW